MAAHHDEQDLPKTWPFTFGAFLIMFGLIWFCLHWALEDVEQSLPKFGLIFWLLLLLGVLVMIAGALYNWKKHPRPR